MSDHQVVSVPQEWEGARVDGALSALLGISRSKAASMAEKSEVLRNGLALRKSDRVSAGDLLEVSMETEPSAETVQIPLEILKDDRDFVVVNKPVGVAAHTGPGWEGPTVLGSLEAAGFSIATGGPQERKGIVSRLDVGTSGAMVVAKTELGYSRLKNAFRNREVDKVYHAVVAGYPDPAAGTIEAPIGRHPSRAWKMAITEDGRPSTTHYEIIEYFAGAALLEVHLETGRTHQIRVHMAAIGHPCVGDVFYGADPVQAESLQLDRQWLHARELGFAHPRTGERVVVEAPYAVDLERAVEILRG